MSPILADLAKTIMTLILGPGSILGIIVATRSRTHSAPVESATAEKARTVQRAEVDDITARWQALFDAQGERLSGQIASADDRITRLETALDETKSALDGEHAQRNLAVAYAQTLRAHIIAGSPPPPPPWPEPIDPTPTTHQED